MNGEIDNEESELEDDVESEEELSEDDVVDGVLETTVVDADVESLVARIDNTDQSEAERSREVRRKLEEANERRSKKLDETFNFNIDDEL